MKGGNTLKLFLATKTETAGLNIQYLLKSGIVLVYTHEEFLSRLSDNLDSVGFTTKAINLLSTPSIFVSMVDAIRKLYNYNIVYFSEEYDAIADHMSQLQGCYVAKSLQECSEHDIAEAMSNKGLKLLRRNKEAMFTTGTLKILLQEYQVSPDAVMERIRNDSKLLKNILLTATQLQNTNSRLLREESVLASQKQHLFDIATRIGLENERTSKQLTELQDTNQLNYINLCAYKNRYDEYQVTLNTVLEHGLGSINEDLYGSIKVEGSVYPICVLYFKEITHTNYLSTYIPSLLKTLLDNHYIPKFLRVLPKNSTKALVKFKDYYNTTYGLDARTLTEYSKFIHLGNPHIVLDMILSNQVPIDVLVILDSTAIDNQFCYGDSVIQYNFANSDQDLVDYELPMTNAVVNNQFLYTDYEPYLLSYYEDFQAVLSSELVDVYYERLPITQTLLDEIQRVFASMG